MFVAGTRGTGDNGATPLCFLYATNIRIIRILRELFLGNLSQSFEPQRHDGTTKRMVQKKTEIAESPLRFLCCLLFKNGPTADRPFPELRRAVVSLWFNPVFSRLVAGERLRCGLLFNNVLHRDS
jgi:hypothetical protein